MNSPFNRSIIGKRNLSPVRLCTRGYPSDAIAGHHSPHQKDRPLVAGLYISVCAFGVFVLCYGSDNTILHPFIPSADGHSYDFGAIKGVSGVEKRRLSASHVINTLFQRNLRIQRNLKRTSPDEIGIRIFQQRAAILRIDCFAITDLSDRQIALGKSRFSR